MSSLCNLQSSFLWSQNQLWNNNLEENRKRKVGKHLNILYKNKLITPIASYASSLSYNTSTNNSGKFGKFGDKYVPELLMTCLSDLEDEFNKATNDERLRSWPEIYLKREDLNHGGAHKINNALAQAMLAKHMGRMSIVMATGAGQHGVATAAVCAKLGLSCTICMGSLDIQRPPSNREDLNHGGAHKINNALAQAMLAKRMGLMSIVTATSAGQHGVATAAIKTVDGTYKDASSEAFREWVANLELSYLLLGSVVGPHPCPTMV
ncbi:Tryptophan synthase beta chain 2 chloroplastic [Bienertia sinuspersici]